MSLLGIKHLVVAVNKMDLLGYSEEAFLRIKEDYNDFAAKLAIHDIHFIPISALKGDNVVKKSENMAWFHGRPLLEYLETAHITSDRNLIDLRFPVQYVIRPHRNFRGYAGTVASGVIRRGDEILVLPSGRKSRVKSLVTYDGELEEAFPPLTVTVTLEDEIDVSRGDMLVHVHNLPHDSRVFEAMVVWMNDEPLQLGKPYRIKHTTNMIQGSAQDIRYRMNVNTLHRETTDRLHLNEIGRTVFRLNRPLLFDTYEKNRTTGCFIVIDSLTNVTVGAGMILDRRPNELIVERKPIPKTAEVHQRASLVTPDDRAERLNQKPATVWLTGLPKSGKTTIAYALEKRLFGMGYTVFVLDGENMRLGISRDLGFSGSDRSENVRRAAEVANLFNNVGLITIAAFVSPYAEVRANARKSIGHDRFIEVYLDVPKDVCKTRDTEGLYSRAEAGEIRHFSGVTAPYEPPTDPEITVPTHEITVAEALDMIIAKLRERGFIG